MRLQHLVIHSDRSVKLAALQALANMALNTTNQKEMEVSCSNFLLWIVIWNIFLSRIKLSDKKLSLDRKISCSLGSICHEVYSKKVRSAMRSLIRLSNLVLNLPFH